ncbi:MAG: response regulator [Candidatus Promineifilaceae bacterium]
MAQRVLVVDDDLMILDLAQRLLEDEGYEVLFGTDAAHAERLAIVERPALLLLDMTLPGANGEIVARRLRDNPETAELPIILMLALDDLGEVVITNESSFDDYLLKPFTAAELITKILPLIREETTKTSVSTGNGELDSKMGGGIPLGSLTLIEGSSGAGKSVLSQQMIFGSLSDGFNLSLFTSENDVKSLVKQMRSLDLDILDYLLLRRLRIFPMELARLGNQATDILLKAMKQERRRHLILIDSLTLAIGHAPGETVLSFFEECKRLCSSGSSVVVVLHSHALDSELLVRLRSLCDAHLQLRTEEVGKKLVKTLEVTKVRGADKTTGNIVSFEVEPGWGMRVIPISKVKG